MNPGMTPMKYAVFSCEHQLSWYELPTVSNNYLCWGLKAELLKQSEKR